MKKRISLILIIVALFSIARGHTLQTPKSKVPYCVFKDKKGTILGNVYIKDLKNNIFHSLVILKEDKGKQDTLYFVDGYKLKNKKGIDIQVPKENFLGYKILLVRKDYIVFSLIDKRGVPVSDNINLAWDYEDKVFQVLQAP